MQLVRTVAGSGGVVDVGLDVLPHISYCWRPLNGRSSRLIHRESLVWPERHE